MTGQAQEPSPILPLPKVPDQKNPTPLPTGDQKKELSFPSKFKADESLTMSGSTPPKSGGQPITLREAILIANSQAIDNRVADAQIGVASALYQGARALWLPNIDVGADYYYHSGPFSNISTGAIETNTRETLMYGVGFVAVVATNDAVFAPRAARNVLESRYSDKQAVNNDVSLEVCEIYFQVLQYQYELAAQKVLVAQAEELVRQVSAMAEGLVPDVEINRAKVELARRKQTVANTEGQYYIAMAELVRILRLPPGESLALKEAIDFRLQVVDPNLPLKELIQIALMHRPELASQSALVRASVERLRQERTRPLMPIVLARPASTSPPGTLGIGSFGGGSYSNSDFGSRVDYDFQLVWELQNLGFGNRAKIRQRRSENEVAVLTLLRAQDQVAADVSQAYASVNAARTRLDVAIPAYIEAKRNLEKNFEGLPQTKRVGNLLVLIIRPQEVVAAIQAMSQAIVDYHASLAEYNRAEFRLNRALGNSVAPLLEEGAK